MKPTMKVALTVFVQDNSGEWGRQTRRFGSVTDLRAASKRESYILQPVVQTDPMNPDQILYEDIGVNQGVGTPALANDYMVVSFNAVRTQDGREKKFSIPNVIMVRADLSYNYVTLISAKGGVIIPNADKKGGETF